MHISGHRLGVLTFHNGSWRIKKYGETCSDLVVANIILCCDELHLVRFCHLTFMGPVRSIEIKCGDCYRDESDG